MFGDIIICNNHCNTYFCDQNANLILAINHVCAFLPLSAEIRNTFFELTINEVSLTPSFVNLEIATRVFLTLRETCQLRHPLG